MSTMIPEMPTMPFVLWTAWTSMELAFLLNLPTVAKVAALLVARRDTGHAIVVKPLVVVGLAEAPVVVAATSAVK